MNTADAIVSKLLEYPCIQETDYKFPDYGEQERETDFDSGELDPDSPEAFFNQATAKFNSVKKIGIYGRRWWRRGAGGTYFKAYIYINDKLVHVTPEDGCCSDDQYLHVATNWLRENGWVNLKRNQPIWALKGQIELDYSAIDVKRERDL